MFFTVLSCRHSLNPMVLFIIYIQRASKSPFTAQFSHLNFRPIYPTAYKISSAEYPTHTSKSKHPKLSSSSYPTKVILLWQHLHPSSYPSFINLLFLLQTTKSAQFYLLKFFWNPSISIHPHCHFPKLCHHDFSHPDYCKSPNCLWSCPFLICSPWGRR